MNSILNYNVGELLLNAKPCGIKNVITGVYFLFYNDVLVYVGQSTNVEKRLMSHFSSKVFDKYHYIKCDEDRLLEVEKHYIDKFKPFYNGTNNKSPIVESMTYVWNNNIIFLNCGLSTDRRIFRVDGDKIIDVFSEEESGLVYRKCGYVWVNNKNFLCSGGVIKRLTAKSIYGGFDLNKKTTIHVSKSDISSLHSITDYYIYAKAMGYKEDWVLATVKDKQHTDQERVFAKLIVSKNDIIMYKGGGNNVYYNGLGNKKSCIEQLNDIYSAIEANEAHNRSK